ncbi:MAG: sulfide/dihydroorotate dehydrogenase-like FAD/NAD-binding protein [Actinobacteria bacterium]|nr:MAG: sulfide/dihydroorotate dehydrogenase-like FAD/NAD-binding protein [Actinomycetota bacterium]
MFEILEKKPLAPNIFQMRMKAPEIAKKAKAGQFLILRIDECGERIPLTFTDFDASAGTVDIVFMVVGATTKHLSGMEPGQALSDMAGPLGRPTEIENYGHVVCVGGGVGAAVMFPAAKALKQAGNDITCILGARDAGLLILEEELTEITGPDRLIITTDDGTKGRKGVVTVPLQEMLERGDKVDLVVAIGPAIMMKFVCKTTEPFGVKTIVSLNPIMVDGTGMCGACRVSVGGETKFGCVDGPEFDGHAVDFDLLMARQRQYLSQEAIAMEKYSEGGCKCQ